MITTLVGDYDDWNYFGFIANWVNRINHNCYEIDYGGLEVNNFNDILFLVSFILFMTGIKFWTSLHDETNILELLFITVMTGLGLWGFVVSCQK